MLEEKILFEISAPSLDLFLSFFWGGVQKPDMISNCGFRKPICTFSEKGNKNLIVMV